MSIETTLSVQLVNALQEQLDNSQNAIMSGRLASIEEYRYSFGYRKGLEDTLTLIEQLKSELMAK